MSRVGPSTKSIFWIGSAFPPRTAAAATRVKRVSGNVAFWHFSPAMSDLSPQYAEERTRAGRRSTSAFDRPLTDIAQAYSQLAAYAPTIMR